MISSPFKPETHVGAIMVAKRIVATKTWGTGAFKLDVRAVADLAQEALEACQKEAGNEKLTWEVWGKVSDMTVECIDSILRGDGKIYYWEDAQ